MFYNRTEAVAKDKVGHIRETADRCDGEHQCDGREPLIPMCVVELAVVFVLNLAEEQLADNSQNVDCRNHNRRCGDNRKRVTEEVAVAENGVVDCCVLKRAEEDGHLCHESAQARQTERCKTGDDVANRKERHYLHQAAHLANVAGVCGHKSYR